MNETSIDKLPVKDRAEQLQAEFGRHIDRVHELAGKAFSRVGRRVNTLDRDTKDDEATLASEFISGFDSLYRSVPDGYHLDIGLSPLKYYELQRHDTLKYLTRKEKTSLGPQYWFKVARFVDNAASMDPDKQAVNVSVKGTNEPDHPDAVLEPVLISRDGLQGTARRIFPEDILSVKVVADPAK